ncbi:MAG: hypothetical protein FJ221_17890 [Lentisphaerae bacterium]|nr:hypothetical protein [Lentisphaerota bacterium]
MSKRTWGGLLLAVSLATTGVRANEWDPSVGLTFVSGFMDVVDWYEDALGADVSWAVPIGMSLGVSYEFTHGSRLGADLGPISLLMVSDARGYDGGDTEFFDVPIGLAYGFNFIPDGKVSPYGRIGFRHHLVSADAVGSATPGFFASVGCEFFRKGVVGLGLELGYDGSTVEMDDGAELKPGEVLFSVRAVF